MKPKSHTLFHFTKSSETLKCIMKDGFWPRYCPEDVSWLGYQEIDLIAYPMVCFCDIPLSRAEEHVQFYGEYGVGLNKDWAERNNLTPILYVSNNHILHKTFRNINELCLDLEESKREQARHEVRYLLAHTKPTKGEMVVDGKRKEKEFYQESEWRYVPKHPEMIACLEKSYYECDETLNICNQVTFKKFRITFTPADVNYLFVNMTINNSQHS